MPQTRSTKGGRFIVVLTFVINTLILFELLAYYYYVASHLEPWIT
jgi:hypothetical protein